MPNGPTRGAAAGPAAGRRDPTEGASSSRIVLISQRAADADDCAVPGHWEAGLLGGAGPRARSLRSSSERRPSRSWSGCPATARPPTVPHVVAY